MESAGNAVIDFGRFCTGFLVIMGIGECRGSQWMEWDTDKPALPVLLAHCALITPTAMIMSILGGLLIYGTIISFTQFFKEEQDF